MVKDETTCTILASWTYNNERVHIILLCTELTQLVEDFPAPSQKYLRGHLPPNFLQLCRQTHMTRVIYIHITYCTIMFTITVLCSQIYSQFNLLLTAYHDVYYFISVGLHAPCNVVLSTPSCDTVTLQWTQPSEPDDITTSVSCTPPSPGCAECTTSPCTITGLSPSTEYVFSVTLNSGGCRASMSTTIITKGEISIPILLDNNNGVCIFCLY